MSAEGTNRGKVGGIRFVALDVVTMALTIAGVVLLLLTTHAVNKETDELEATFDRYAACEQAANDLMEVSTYLTTQSRLFTATYHVAYLNNYFWEIGHDRRREADVETLQLHYPDSDAAEYLQQALSSSDKLANNEMYSMKLIVTAINLPIEDESQAAALDAIAFRRGDELLTSDEMLAKARMLVTYEPYEHDVDRVTKQVMMCKDELADMLAKERQQRVDRLDRLFLWQNLLTVGLLVIVLFTAIVFITTVFRPLAEYIRRLDRNERLQEKGASELRVLARAYNAIFDANHVTQSKLLHEADHDALTGLYNRGAFKKYIAERHGEPLAVAIIDIDNFKGVNDQYGHEVGDHVLQRVAKALRDSFRTTDFPCRLGGDEFIVVMLEITPENRDVIMRKAKDIARTLQVAEGDTPAIYISAGVAFGDGAETPDDLYRLADKALYRVKEGGRRGLAFYDEEGVHAIADN